MVRMIMVRKSIYHSSQHLTTSSMKSSQFACCQYVHYQQILNAVDCQSLKAIFCFQIVLVAYLLKNTIAYTVH
jgi:hypothetical protein